MAVTQISRIQHRRGLEQDLPQLASAELGWSLDTRRLYIGNGTLEEGAPTVGLTRILTQYDVAEIQSNIAFTNYTFVGNAATYDSVTGPSALAPVVRPYQRKLDDIVNIRDFGAIGDNTTDDTSAINRAIQQIYKSTVSPTEARARRTIFFPGGTYLISNPILVFKS
jgi:polygalacturonase